MWNLRCELANCGERNLMKKVMVFIALVFVLTVPVMADPLVRFYSVNSSVPSGLILDGLNNHCQNVVLTLDSSKANYSLEVQYAPTDNPRNPDTILVLYNKTGDSIFNTKTHDVGNALKDACTFLKIEKQ
jgi:hypothetical protein